MSLSSDTARVQYTVTTTPQNFAVPFYILASSDIQVIKTVSGVDTTLVLNTDYTVSGAATNPSTASVNGVTGIVGATLTIVRATAATQPTTYIPNSAFPATTAERNWDRVTMLVQRLVVDVQRCLRFASSNAAAAVMALNSRKNKMLGFDDNGDVQFMDPLGAASLTGDVIQVSSYSALRAVSVTDFASSRQAMVSGAAASADGGDGLFTYNAASSATDNSATVIQPTTGAGRWLRCFSGAVNVKWFGAKGDGVADDTAAIQAAIDYVFTAGGGTVFFPLGTYNTTAPLNHKLSVNMEGAGITSSHIKSTHATAIQADATNPSGNCEFFGLKITGTDYAFHTNGEATTRVRFIQCYLDGGADGYGAYLNGQAIECEWRSCVLTQKIKFTGAFTQQNNVFDDCRINATGAAPTSNYIVEVDGSGIVGLLTFRNVVFEVGGVLIAGSGNVTQLGFSDCGWYDPSVVGMDAIKFDGSSGSVISGVSLRNIYAEDFTIRNTASGAFRVFGGPIFCYSFIWADQTAVFLAGVTTQSSISGLNGNNTWVEHEGTIYGQKQTFDLGFRPNKVIIPVQTLTVNSATPSVIAGNNFKADNSLATTITNFANGTEGQEITVYFVNSVTTIQHGASITLSGGKDYLGVTQTALKLIQIGSVWFEVSRSQYFPPVVTLTNNSATPSIGGGSSVFKADNSLATTITNFTNGAEGQRITVSFVNGTTTIQNNATILLAGAADFVGTSADTLSLVMVNSVWRETARSVN
jgi:hypothetical protein